MSEKNKAKAESELQVIYEAPAASPEEARLRACRTIYSQWPQVLAAIAQKAAEGSVPHAKFLLDCWNSPSMKSAVAEKEAKDESRNQLVQLLIDSIADLQAGRVRDEEVN